MDHLPECLHNKPPLAGGFCICPELRACEQRVERRIDAMLAKANDYGERTGYAAGIATAREAVAAAVAELKPVLARDYQRLSARDGAQEAENAALAAIDGLVKP